MLIHLYINFFFFCIFLFLRETVAVASGLWLPGCVWSNFVFVFVIFCVCKWNNGTWTIELLKISAYQRCNGTLVHLFLIVQWSIDNYSLYIFIDYCLG